MQENTFRVSWLLPVICKLSVRIHVAQGRSSFEELLDILGQIPDQDIDSAVTFVRNHRAGIATRGRLPGLADVLGRLDRNALYWLETMLCARSQQSG